MPQYFRSIARHSRDGFPDVGRYKVYGDKPVEYPETVWDDKRTVFPTGEIRVIHTPGKTIPHYGEVEDYSDLSAIHPRLPFSVNPNPLATALGVHPQLLNHIAEQEQKKGNTTLSNAITVSSYPRSYQKLVDPRGIHLAKTVSKLKDDPRVSPDTLFTSLPGTLKIDEAFVDPSLSTSVPTAIGLAKNDFPHTEIMASGDLSKFSSKLAKNALDRGLIVPNPMNPQAGVTNSFEQNPMGVNANNYDPTEDEPVWGFRRVPQNHVENARETVREILRGPRKRNTQPVTSKGLSDQFVIPGMEGYLK